MQAFITSVCFVAAIAQCHCMVVGYYCRPTKITGLSLAAVAYKSNWSCRRNELLVFWLLRGKFTFL